MAVNKKILNRGGLVLSLLLLIFFIGRLYVQSIDEHEDWHHYKKAFISKDGAVVDAINGGIRHSEGQGMGMLLAVSHQDQEAFDQTWVWARDHLQVREGDHLFAWRWKQELPHVTDYNNATDGDILIAWALLRAFDQWHEERYQLAAVKIIDDIQELLIVREHGELLLLPGHEGFVKENGIIINLSYWVFPAFEAFKGIQPNRHVWSDLVQSGLVLMRKAAFGPWQLPPDWLLVGERLMPAPQFPKHFGLDAVRIPLYLKWAGHGDHSAVIKINRFWAQFTGIGAWPEWAGLEQTNVHMADTMQGVQSVAVYSACNVLQDCMKDVKTYWHHKEYYQVTLQLLAQLAERDFLK